MISARVKSISYEPAIGPPRLGKLEPYPDWLISSGESGHGARPLDPEWIRNVISDCRLLGIARFHRQWGHYHTNPLVVEEGLTVDEARRRDPHGKGGALVDGKLVREFPVPHPAPTW